MEFLFLFRVLRSVASIGLSAVRPRGRCSERAGADAPEGADDVDRRERPQGTPTLLAVGRFVEKKGFEDLIRAVGRAGDRSAFRLRIVGDGPLRPRLESVVAELDLGSKVEMPGWRTPDEVAEEMVRADALAMSSVVAADGDMEGLPLVIAEAMSTACSLGSVGFLARA